MNPIDKLKETDYDKTFCSQDISDTNETYIGLYCIVSDNGHIWTLDILTGIEVTSNGLLYRIGKSCQYKHCRLIKFDKGVKVIAEIAGSAHTCFIVGEMDNKWIISNGYCQDLMTIEKTDVISTGGEA